MAVHEWLSSVDPSGQTWPNPSLAAPKTQIAMMMIAAPPLPRMPANLRVTGSAATLQPYCALIAGKSREKTGMKISGAAIGLSLLVLTAVPVSAVESSIKGASVASVDTIWAKIGDFCGIGNWHPAIEKCALSADGKTRTLSLRG